MPDPAIKSPDNHVHFSDHVFRTSDSYSGNDCVLSTKTSDNYGNNRSWNGGKGVFGAQTKMVNDEKSGVCSPPLWTPRSPQHRQNHYRSLSPSLRAQAIARGQRELMEMVNRMPEGCYELSLKDLVEHPMVEEKQESFSKDRALNGEEEMYRRKKGKKTKGMIKKVQMSRSGSIDSGGFLLKMVFPISWGSRKMQNTNNSGMNSGSKDGRVSPKPLLPDLSYKSADKEWWKKGFSEEGESERGGLSSKSGSSKSTGSSPRRHRSGCGWSFIFSRKGEGAS